MSRAALPVPPISFYLPSAPLANSVPSSIDDYWSWINEMVPRHPATLASGKPCTWLGPYNWTAQTYIYLRDAGLDCAIAASLPSDGIVVTHSDFLPRGRVLTSAFIVEIKPDRSLKHVWSPFVIVQNRRDPIRRGLQRFLIASAVVPYWPQPGLIPRNRERGDRFENVAFAGNPEQFLPDVATLAAKVRALGLTWRMKERWEWHDYSDIDAIVAVRPAAPRRPKDPAYFSPETKPASKLYNAWLAGVPAILSPDVAYRDLRRTDLDYLEARTVAEIVAQLTRLQGDPSLRRAMVENGGTRGSDFAANRTVSMWMEIVRRDIAPAYRRWSASPWRRRWLTTSRAASLGVLMKH